MNNINIKNLEENIRYASPLELPSVLQQAELYDAQETRQVIDEIYHEFKSGNDLQDKILIPIFTSIIDGIMESTAATRSMRKKGLTANRLVVECINFRYDIPTQIGNIPDAYTEWKNINEYTKTDFKKYGEEKRQTYNRDYYEDKKRLNDYKDQKFANNNGRINATDEYTGKKNVYQYKKNPDGRRNIEKYKHDHQAEVDHIVPLKEIHNQLKGNYALTDEDIKDIANKDSNFALTSARINRGAGAPGHGGKFEDTNEKFVEKQRKKEENGEPNLGLSEEEKENMLKMGKKAQKDINNNADVKIFKNLTGQGTGNTKEIWGKSTKNAAIQSKDYIIGNAMLFIIKPLYYEISDILKNGLKDGVDAKSTSQAFSIRFGRLKEHVCKNILPFIGNNAWEFVKGFISSLIESIISLFVGIFKQILKLIKEGIKVFVQAGKVLFGKNASQMSTAEKGDAIIKILGGTVISVCGIGIEALINKLGIGEPWSVVFSTMLTGIASALFMFTLDKMDLFSVKDEKRLARINDIFNERIKDIEDARNTMNLVVIETMRKQHLDFSTINEELRIGINNNNIDKINNELLNMAKFLKTSIPYKDNNEFCKYFNTQELTL